MTLMRHMGFGKSDKTTVNIKTINNADFSFLRRVFTTTTHTQTQQITKVTAMGISSAPVNVVPYG